MVETCDSGTRPKCGICGNPISHLEPGGIGTDENKNLAHTDCLRERHGYESMRDEKWLREMRYEQMRRYAHFDQMRPNAHGARRIA